MANLTPTQLAYLRLSLAEGVGPILFSRLLERFGDAEAVLSASSAELRDVKGVGDSAARAIHGVADDRIEAECVALAEREVTLLCRADADYPEALRTIHDPPPVLYVRGRLEPNDAVAMAIVGSRRCTHYGLEQAGRFGGLLGRAGFTVVSGGARGIDSAAHRGALTAGGRTVAVMGCGLSHVYPRENAELFDRIVAEDRGAIVSALPMFVGPESKNFPARNRIISGLSQGVLVIEAARRSGSLITARLADEQGRAVFALPGRVDSPFSEGTNHLIRDGVTLVQNLDDVLEQLGQLGRTLAEQPAAKPAPKPAPNLPPNESAILAVLKQEAGPARLDEIVTRTRLPAHQVTAAMTMLTIKGLVAQQAGNVFHAR